MTWDLHRMDCRLAMSMLMEPDSVDSIVCDPPYGLSREPDAAEVLRHWLNGDDYTHSGNGFMGRSWDSFVPGPSVWREAYRVLKPGGYLLAFFGTRTYDLGCMAIRLAGFEIRDELCWLYGSGFPKSLDVSKAIDKAAGAEREVIGDKRDLGIWHSQNCSNDSKGIYSDKGGHLLTVPATDDAKRWQGWGTALKPAHEPIVLARKPLAERTVAANVLMHGTGGLHIDACRVGTDEKMSHGGKQSTEMGYHGGTLADGSYGTVQHDAGRFPPNVLHDGSDEVLACFPDSASQLRAVGPANGAKSSVNTYGDYGPRDQTEPRGDSGSAARFFPSCALDDDDVATQRVLYCAKASRADRNEGCEQLPAGNNMRVNAPRASEDEKHATTHGNHHPTVKPTALMRWLVRLVTPPSGTVLDPFAGSGSTGKAALLEGFSFIGCEMTDEYADIAEARLRQAAAARAP